MMKRDYYNIADRIGSENLISLSEENKSEFIRKINMGKDKDIESFILDSSVDKELLISKIFENIMNKYEYINVHNHFNTLSYYRTYPVFHKYYGKGEIIPKPSGIGKTYAINELYIRFTNEKLKDFVYSFSNISIQRNIIIPTDVQNYYRYNRLENSLSSTEIPVVNSLPQINYKPEYNKPPINKLYDMILKYPNDFTKNNSGKNIIEYIIEKMGSDPTDIDPIDIEKFGLYSEKLEELKISNDLIDNYYSQMFTKISYINKWKAIYFKDSNYNKEMIESLKVGQYIYEKYEGYLRNGFESNYPYFRCMFNAIKIGIENMNL